MPHRTRHSRTSTDDSSSRSLRATLTELAATLEVGNTTRWKKIQRYPRVLQELQFWAWRSPWPHELSRAIEGLASILARRPAVVAARAPVAADRVAPPQACPDAPCFQGLGDLPDGEHYGGAQCLSADGTTVGGGSATGARFRWRADTGIVYLGDLPGHLNCGALNALSADGEVAAGWSSSANGDNAYYKYREAFRWTASGRMVASRTSPEISSSAEAISADGDVIAGYVTTGNCYRRAALWTREGGWSIEDDRPSDLTTSSFGALSSDGRWAAGTMALVCFGGSSDACRWSQGSGFTSLGVSYEAECLVVSDLGEVAGAIGADDEAFITTPDGQSAILDDLPGGKTSSRPRSILPGGERIVGWGTSPAGLEAVLWDESRRIHRVADVLASAGVVIPEGWTLSECAGIARNAGVVTLCGSGLNPNGEAEAWIARYEDSRAASGR
jgi:hypothetical protein